ncbi:MAG: hypothetical protein EOO01_00235 [Chitinophagaceae bacterium]|nr:MAG: hypothetical protein EOO01_00235 [Chitinophagaceae bacterium]
MACLKSFCNVRANSIIESVVAICIISICLYIAILVIASVFTPRTSAKFYTTRNNLDEFFFLSQLNDSLSGNSNGSSVSIEREILGTSLQKITLTCRDSTNRDYKKIYYVGAE